MLKNGFMKLLKNVENASYQELKDLLIDIYNSVCENKEIYSFDNLSLVHKRTIALRAFDLVSIAMSIIGYLQLKQEPDRYYKALCTINDAKYLATSCSSNIAIKINLHMLSCIEFTEKNYTTALELVKSALNIPVEEIYDFNQRLLEFQNKIERINQQIAISQNAPKFSSDGQEDPLLALLKVGRTIAVETNIDTLLTIIAQEIKLVLNADRCTVFILDKEKNELWSKVALGLETQEIRFSADSGLAGHVVKTGETINIKDVYSDPRFNKEIDQKTGYKTENILCMPIRNMSHEITGVFQVLNKKDGDFNQKDEDLLIAIGSSAGIAIENANLFSKQQKFIQQQKDLLSGFVDTLSASIDARDKITSGHSKRVTMFVELICDVLNLSEKEKDLIRQASLLHDIGKIGIRDSVLQKEGKLTFEEYQHIQEHAKITHDILEKIYSSEDFQEVASIASSHHEKYDGSGYYKKLSGQDIPLGGRILAVGDVFDAITSKRHYRSKMNIEDAINILIQGKNGHFDANIVDAFLSIQTDLIMKVFLIDTQMEMESSDKQILNKFKLIDLYNLITSKDLDNYTQEEKTFVDIFAKYYEGRCEEVSCEK